MRKQQKLSDLYWYFNSFASICGLRSNYKEMTSGSGSFEWEPDIDSISKARQVEKKLAQLSLHDRKVLEAYLTFQEERSYPILRFVYSEYLQVVRLKINREELSKIKTRKKHDELLAEAKQAVKLAFKNYEEIAKEKK